MPEVRKIKATEIVADIRARFTDFELMAKYGLSWDRLQQVLTQLVQAKVIRSAELEERSAYFDDPLNRKLTRASYRAYLRVPVPLQDRDDSENQGVITDLSETGFRTRGIEARVSDERVFSIRAGKVSDVETFELKATCRWFDQSEVEAGFAFSAVSDQNLGHIRRLIQTLGMGNRNLLRRKSSSTQ
jgi:hypothetical protein